MADNKIPLTLASEQSHRKDKPPLYSDSSTANLTQTCSTTPFRTTFASLSLHMTDRIRLLNFPPETMPQISALVRTRWRSGIQSERLYGNSYELKLSGTPWRTGMGWGDWSEQTLNSRLLIMGLLAGLFNMGWVLNAAVDISRKEFDKDTLILRAQRPPPPACEWMFVNFSSGDSLHLVGAPKELGTSLVQAYGREVQRYNTTTDSALKIKFWGYPWRAEGVETVKARELVLVLLEVLEQYGFSLYASIDQECGRGKDSRSSEADVWYCNRQRDWTPGVPIYHH
ncbi:MAG: hypothetical protein M1820_010557 [Bogoriella megaspora]|nr:MAG: hypothetical protein M1820_010557 [Bogoriella megaspora]